MMKFHRRLSTVKAISFDLDDTLYSNKPVMLAIEKKMIAYFAQTLAEQQHKLPEAFESFSMRYWSQFRRQAIHKTPELGNDVVRVRLESYRLGLSSLGFSAAKAQKMAQSAVDYFIELRSDFTVPDTSKKLLEKLSEQYTLVAISNGNVDCHALGIADYFQHIYHAGWQKNEQLLKQKPSTDMFDLACKQLAIESQQLLHVGDCGRSDIQGALRAGCQAAWLSCYDVGKPISVLPHLEITDINQLKILL